ncbi:MAG: hypothetical protein Athens041674_96 [Parcubacteria group bacterium Athens0416_74]|nr:MAG: hypothetical protein Athens041674_96 [Parcubacteria group bacterium Athens0416_74]
MTKLPVQHIWTVICSRSSIDTDTNNVSLFNLIEKFTLTVPKEQVEKAKQQGARGIVFPVEFEIVTRYRREDKTKSDAFDSRLRMLNPKGEETLSNEQKIAMKEGIDNLRVRNQISGLPVDENGVYWVVIETKPVNDANYIEVYRLPLEVVVNVK